MVRSCSVPRLLLCIESLLLGVADHAVRHRGGLCSLRMHEMLLPLFEERDLVPTVLQRMPSVKRLHEFAFRWPHLRQHAGRTTGSTSHPDAWWQHCVAGGRVPTAASQLALPAKVNHCLSKPSEWVVEGFRAGLSTSLRGKIGEHSLRKMNNTRASNRVGTMGRSFVGDRMGHKPHTPPREPLLTRTTALLAARRFLGGRESRDVARRDPTGLLYIRYNTITAFFFLNSFHWV
jgi:hypothetical protein